MRLLRPSAARGHTVIDWLDSWHTFSFGDYHDAAWMSFRGLRVINDDVIQPGQGFGTHPHRDMEIVSWMLGGALEHRDSTGGGGIIRPGDAQYMSAGTGIWHSEFNPSDTEAAHLLQIWIAPARRGGAPRYGQVNVPESARRGRWGMVAGPGAGAALPLAADATIYAALLSAGERLEHALAPGRHAWIHVGSGSVRVDGQPMTAGDGMGISAEPGCLLIADSASEVLLFDLG